MGQISFRIWETQLAKADIEAIREATNKAWVLGNDRFRKKMIEALSGRRASHKARVRPCKGSKKVK